MDGVAPRRPLRGVPAFAWGVALIVFAVVGILLVTAYIVVTVIAGVRNAQLGGLEYNHWLFLYAMAGLVPLVTFTLRTKLELESGYTTNPLRDPQLALLDWKTGVTLRDAGEPLTGWSEYRRRLHTARNDTGSLAG